MCVVYTVIISIMFFFGWLLSDADSLLAPTPSKALLMLLFSCIVGFASLLLSENKTPVFRIVLHFAICFAAFILIFIVGGGFSLKGGAWIISTVIYCLVYGTVMVVRAIAGAIHRKNSDNEKEYTSVLS